VPQCRLDRRQRYSRFGSARGEPPPGVMLRWLRTLDRLAAAPPSAPADDSDEAAKPSRPPSRSWRRRG